MYHRSLSLKRKEVSECYDSLFNFKKISKPVMPADIIYNYGYYPVFFEKEEIVLNIIEALRQNEVSARRYFYPSLNKLPFLQDYQPCDIAESLSSRVLTLPLFYDLSKDDVKRICGIINQQVS